MAMYREPNIIPGLMGTSRVLPVPAPGVQTGGPLPPQQAIVARTGGPDAPYARDVRTGGPLPPTQASIRTGGPGQVQRLPQVHTGGPLPPGEVVNPAGGMLVHTGGVDAPYVRPTVNTGVVDQPYAGNSGIVPPGFNQRPGMTRPSGLTAPPAMPQGQAMMQRPTSNNGVAPQASAPTGRPAMMGTLFRGRLG